MDPVPTLQLPSGEATSVLTFAHTPVLPPSLTYDTGFPHVRHKVLLHNSLHRSDIKINSLSPGGGYCERRLRVRLQGSHAMTVYTYVVRFLTKVVTCSHHSICGGFVGPWWYYSPSISPLSSGFLLLLLNIYTLFLSRAGYRLLLNLSTWPQRHLFRGNLSVWHMINGLPSPTLSSLETEHSGGYKYSNNEWEVTGQRQHSTSHKAIEHPTSVKLSNANRLVCVVAAMWIRT